MSLRALKKRENQHIQGNSNNLCATTNKQSLYRKSIVQQQQQQQRKYLPNNETRKYNLLNSKATQLKGRKSVSNPELHILENNLESYELKHLIRTKSENDIQALVLNKPMPARSEVCLQSISTHNYQAKKSTTANRKLSNSKPSVMQKLSGVQSNHSLSISQSLTSAASTTTINTSVSNASTDISNTVLRVPIIGYEVMEERARFTVYKLRVENPITNDCWLVLRRYTDFVRLNTKLKQAFPHITLLLPRKKIFGDNFNAVFLDNRVQGLQMFVNSIMAMEELRNSKIVRDFFCLDEPPTYSESMEECRAIFEAQEETITHLKLQINSKNELILNLQQKLRDEIMEKNQLKEALKNLTALHTSEGSSNNSSTASN